jgi:hypothetical protein
LASKGRTGYGQFGTSGKAHRLAWDFENEGGIPEGMVVCHSCDNRGCANPKHLFIGTQAQNIWDCKRKGRTARGLDFPHARFSEADVRLVRKIRAEQGLAIRKIAAIFDVSSSTVRSVLTGRTHSWVK